MIGTAGMLCLAGEKSIFGEVDGNNVSVIDGGKY